MLCGCYEKKAKSSLTRLVEQYFYGLRSKPWFRLSSEVCDSQVKCVTQEER